MNFVLFLVSIERVLPAYNLPLPCTLMKLTSS